MKFVRTGFGHLACSAVATFALVVGMTTVAQAAPASTAAPSTTASSTRDGFAKAVARLDPYVVRAADGTFVVDAPDAVVTAIPAEDYSAVLASLDRTNADVRDGALVTDVDGSVHAAQQPVAPAANPNSIVWNWWGAQIHLDAETSHIIIDAIRAAVGVAGILAILVNAGVISAAAGVALSIVSAILMVVATALTACNTPDGLDLFVTYVLLGWCQQPTAV